jgi:hypothetical protein
VHFWCNYLQASAVAGSTTLTLPAATDTLVGRTTTDTLENKTLFRPLIEAYARSLEDLLLVELVLLPQQ